MTWRAVWLGAYAIAGLTAGMGGVTGVGAQEPIRRDRFDFEVLQTEHFDIHFYEEEAEMARVAGRMAERWYTRLSRVLGHELRGRQVIILYASHPHFQQTSVGGRFVGETTRGITEANKRRIALPFASTLADTDHVIGHELVHAFQFDMTESDRRRAVTQPLALRMPLWFIEGMAEYLIGGATDPITLMWIRDAAIDDRLPTLDALRGRRDFAFRFGHAFWAYIAGRFGDGVVGRILNAAARGGSAERAFQSVLSISPDSLAAEWKDEIAFAFVDVIEAARQAAPPPRQVAIDVGNLNLAPALGPHGRRLAYISDRNGRSLNLFVSDLSAGDTRDVQVIARNTRFEYIQSVASAGEWSPDGTQLAYGLSEGAKALLVIVTGDGDRTLERSFPGIGEINDPTWSPDGHRLAFSGLVGGQPDLFVYDLDTDDVTRLTDDPFAELHAAWSPDGRTIVFATDRFTSNVQTLEYGPYRLALMDPATGRIGPVAAPRGVSFSNPQWSRDGQSVFFVGNRGGLLDIYRLELGTGELRQVTRLPTGAVGITPLGPALTAARHADAIAFSVYEHGRYRIATLTGDALEGSAVK